MDGEKEGGFRELAPVVAVFAVADGADGQHDLYVRTAAAEHVEGLLQAVGTLRHAEHFLLKQRLGALLAVVDNLACLLQPVDMVGAECEEYHAGCSGIAALDGVEHADGVVHGAKGIDCHGETLIAEAAADAIGKARPDEEQGFARFYLERCLGYVNNRSEIHVADVLNSC